DGNRRRVEFEYQFAGGALNLAVDMHGAGNVDQAAALERQRRQWIVDERQVDVLDFQHRSGQGCRVIFKNDRRLLKNQHRHAFVKIDRPEQAGDVPAAVSTADDTQPWPMQLDLADGEIAV